MTTNDSFERRLGAWLEADSARRVPDHLDAVLVRTVATRQRPAWSSLERWLPMSTQVGGRMTVAPLAVWLIAVTALLAALLGGALLTGAVRLPFALAVDLLAPNGRIFVVDGTSLKSYAADGTDPRVAATLPAGSIAPSVSPDGRSIAYLVGSPPRLDVLRIADGQVTSIAVDGAQALGGPISWSPDGSRLLFQAYDGTFEHLVTASADASQVQAIVLDPTGVDGALAQASSEHIEMWPAGWSPSGEHVAFVAAMVDAGQGSLYVVRPDGTDVRRIGPTFVATDSASWSPDPAVERLAYSTPRGADLFVELIDVPSGETADVGMGFWPSWSPDGSRLAYWHDSTVVADTAAILAGSPDLVRPTPSFLTQCQDQSQLAGQAFCGPAAWSPDGQRLLALDIVGGSVLSVMADGSGQPIVIPLDTPSPITETVAAWQPLR